MSSFSPFSKEELFPQEEMLEIRKQKGELFIGLPKESYLGEKRVCLTPDAVAALCSHGHRIVIETGAGDHANYSDRSYSEAGAKISSDVEEAFKCSIVLKVAPPTEKEIEYMNPKTILISSLQLKTQNKSYLKSLTNKQITAVAFDYIKDENETYPIVKSLSEIAEVIVVAPSENKSAASSSLTIGKPLKPIQIEKNVYAIDATPSDCVHLALCGFIKESIDLVVTGINFGANLGDDVIYSGTVAGAIEGRFLGLPSIAMSLASWECKHFDTAGDVAKLLVAQIDKAPLAYNTIINVNVPDIPMGEIKGIKSTRLGNRHKSEPSIQDLKDPSLYWIGENGKEADNGEGTDFHAVSNNFVSVTPLQIDLTKYPELKQVSEWLEDIDY